MVIEVPDFINSKYLIIDEKGWRLDKNAPRELQDKFNEFMNSINKEVK